MNASTQVNVYDDRQSLSQALMRYIIQLAARSIKERGQFCLALSGGSLIDIMAIALDQDLPNFDINWAKWHIFWADERWVPWQSPESNYGVANKRFLSRVPIPKDQTHAMDTSLPLDKTAKNYAAVMDKIFKPDLGQYPRFDLILLGIGDDGHTASLFPNHPVSHETRAWVSPVTEAPKPPPDRITLTLPVINHARHIAWVANGSGKADIIARIFNPSPRLKALPAECVDPLNGDMQWFTDQAASASLLLSKQPVKP